MKRKLAATMLALASTFVQAQELTKQQKAVACSQDIKVVEATINEYKERLFWVSKLESTVIALFVNHKTKTWSLLQWNERIACVIDAGTDFDVVLPGKSI